MEAEEVLKLYDSYWFDIDIFTTKQAFPETISADFQHQEPSLSPSVQTGSRSLHCLCSDTSFSLSSQTPDSVIVVTKLETVFCGIKAKDEDVEIPVTRKKVDKKKQRRNKKGSKSLTDLEFEELKGFMDLGFVFTEEDKDSRLVSIIPGLQRSRIQGDEYKVSRPYLSEAWAVLDQTKVTNQLINWRLQIPNGEIGMKDLLRGWAQSVASTVK
ncbi:Fetuin-B like [Heracleum sosnowskyi]|uniref:Fetuin-B like n=1 Tax=Heracleum sosnowskyi TaxID=360622 RepID=A0AAD8MXL5_9APIA|nr:Fetuin-B like [Heracleum sosnowskyi]